MKFICPVCAYSNLLFAPADYNICPCCGTEFGNDDFDICHEKLRQNWTRAGAKWWSPNTRPPLNWNAFTQLISGGYAYSYVAPDEVTISRKTILSKLETINSWNNEELAGQIKQKVKNSISIISGIAFIKYKLAV